MRGELVECDQIIHEFSEAFNQGRSPVLSAAAYNHIATCSRCRAGLLLLVRAFAPEPDRSAMSDSCEACQADLAAFIDLEAESPAQAATIYPHVWWHLWQCETCAQTYEFTHTLLQARQSGLLRPLRLSRQVAQKILPVVKNVHLDRKTLLHLLPVSAGLVMGTRSADNRFMLFDDSDDEPEQHQFKVVVDEQTADTWQVTVTIFPPPTGLLMLSLGSFRRVAPFSDAGVAVIQHIPADLLLSADGPTLDIEVVATPA